MSLSGLQKEALLEQIAAACPTHHSLETLIGSIDEGNSLGRNLPDGGSLDEKIGQLISLLDTGILPIHTINGIEVDGIDKLRKALTAIETGKSVDHRRPASEPTVSVQVGNLSDALSPEVMAALNRIPFKLLQPALADYIKTRQERERER